MKRFVGFLAIVALAAVAFAFGAGYVQAPQVLLGQLESVVQVGIQRVLELQAAPASQDAAASAEGEAAAYMDATNQAAYAQLDQAGQQRYRAILVALEQRQDAARFESASSGAVQATVEAVLADHPEIFWMNPQYSLESFAEGTCFSVRFAYDYSAAQAAQVQVQIDQAAALVAAQVATVGTQYEQARVIHDYLVANVDYDLDAPHGQTIVGALVDRTAVCASYAKAFQYLAQKAGISCAYLTGVAEGTDISGDHAWNSAVIDGEVTYIDVTFDDPIIVGGGPSGGIRYDYFCISAQQMAQDHTEMLLGIDEPIF